MSKKLDMFWLDIFAMSTGAIIISSWLSASILVKEEYFSNRMDGFVSVLLSFDNEMTLIDLYGKFSAVGPLLAAKYIGYLALIISLVCTIMNLYRFFIGNRGSFNE